MDLNDVPLSMFEKKDDDIGSKSEKEVEMTSSEKVPLPPVQHQVNSETPDAI